MKAHGHVVIQVFKALNKIRKSEFKITGKRGGGGWFGLKLPTLRAVVSPPVVTLRKGFCLFHSVTTGGETIADRAGAACEYILQGGTFSCIW